ncbi:MAG: thioredoxin family protein [Candidatus Caenarcaniphilales bacterium]|nr:thioredoxin family protein [Candidatus Caenarcaniphilales bacterium]
MVLTKSAMIDLGNKMPDFELIDTISGKPFSSHDLAGGKAKLIVFMCNHCPFVQHILYKLVDLLNVYQHKGIGVATISSNDSLSFPEDSPEKMKLLAAQYLFEFPYLYDESQQVAKAFGATCTPDFFLFDSEGKLAYRGQFDSARPGGSIPVTGEDLRNAMDAILEGKSINSDQKPSIGCNIKWKS